MRVGFYNAAGRDLVTIIVNCDLPRWPTRYIITTTLLEWKPLRKVNSIEAFRRLTGDDIKDSSL